jgi:hypothetical protein
MKSVYLAWKYYRSIAFRINWNPQKMDIYNEREWYGKRL